MKVNAWKKIDLEVEVDVSIEDLIQELDNDARELCSWHRKMQAINAASKILSVIGTGPLMMIDGDTSGPAQAIRERLLPLVVWAERQLLESALTVPSPAPGPST